MNELKFEKSRFLFEIDFYSDGPENFTVDKSRFIDDQYTPGIFNVYQMKSLSPLYDFSMLWKPVAYLTDERSIEANTLMEIYDLKNHVVRNDSTDHGIVDAFYTQKNIASLNVSVGHSGDGTLFLFVKQIYDEELEAWRSEILASFFEDKQVSCVRIHLFLLSKTVDLSE